MYRQTAIVFSTFILLQTVGGSTWLRNAPMSYYRSSGKRQQLPYHPVARFRGADTRPFYFEPRYYKDSIPLQLTQGQDEESKMNAGELLALLFSGLKDEETAKMRGTLRFGITR